MGGTWPVVGVTAPMGVWNTPGSVSCVAPAVAGVLVNEYMQLKIFAHLCSVGRRRRCVQNMKLHAGARQQRQHHAPSRCATSTGVMKSPLRTQTMLGGMQTTHTSACRLCRHLCCSTASPVVTLVHACLIIHMSVTSLGAYHNARPSHAHNTSATLLVMARSPHGRAPADLLVGRARHALQHRRAALQQASALDPLPRHGDVVELRVVAPGARLADAGQDAVRLVGKPVTGGRATPA